MNSNRLKGKNKLNRMKELMDKSLNESVVKFEVELTKKGADGNYYGIVRENSSYYIKKAEPTDDILIAEDFKHIGGLANKDHKYDSYSKAIKNLDFKLKSLKEAYNSNEEINTFVNDNILENNAFGGGTAYGFENEAYESDVTESEVNEVEDINGKKAPEDNETSGDNLGGDFGDEKTKGSTSDNMGHPRKNGHDDVNETLNLVGFGSISILDAMKNLDNDVKKKV